MNNDAFKFCVSAVAMKVAAYGLQLVIHPGMSTPLLINLIFFLLLYSSVI